uniref:Uncharacterized protein n=1 Tax=Bursaphelenchus xylophilus TaxID=6326 RepID=A0A1I7SRJ0_BURXY
MNSGTRRESALLVSAVSTPNALSRRPERGPVSGERGRTVRRAASLPPLDGPNAVNESAGLVRDVEQFRQTVFIIERGRGSGPVNRD